MDEKSRPNILFIIIDATRADHFSAYGYPRLTTPNMDRIASEGVLYENAISPAGWTLPATTSIFTGTYVAKHGVNNENHVLGNKLITMPEVLKRAGYHTIGFCTNDWISEATGLARGFNEYYRFNYSRFIHKAKRFLNSVRNGGKDSWAFAINQRIKRWLRQNKAEKPFFMFVHYGELHLPYQLPRPYNTRFLPEGMSYQEAMRVNQDPKAFYAGVAKMNQRDFEISKALYDCALTYVDDRVQEIYAELKRVGQLDQTIIIITSDHGESLGEHGHFDHYYVLYDCLLKVPLIIRYPQLFPAGTRIKKMVQTLDILPTLKEILGLFDPELNEMQGLALPPLDKNGEVREFTIAERYKDLKGLKKSYPDRDLAHLKQWELDRKIAIRTEKYKLIDSTDYEPELFDLENDPAEQHNIFYEQKPIAEELRQKITSWRGTFTAATSAGQEANFDDAMRKRLESLGYLG